VGPGISKGQTRGSAAVLVVPVVGGDSHAESAAPFATTVIARPIASPNLSNRELEVLTSVAAGLSDKQVAGRLGISPKTVRNHLSKVFVKLSASNRVEAVINAMRVGLLSL
jgi:DNA-binding NarL/FixJ family response regulator